MTKPLTRADKREAFEIATRSPISWYGEEVSEGVTDERLTELLSKVLGIFGGSGGPNSISIAYSGSGLKIWAGWTTVNHVTDMPIFQGSATVKMAREVYKIADPTDDQMALF